jgi:hypothetical protein
MTRKAEIALRLAYFQEIAILSRMAAMTLRAVGVNYAFPHMWIVLFFSAPGRPHAICFFRSFQRLHRVTVGRKASIPFCSI